jgi:hypothetical protein
MGYLGTAPPPPTPLPTTKSPSAPTVEGVRAWTRSLRPPRDHAETSLTVGRARPKRNSRVRTMLSGVRAYGATERGFRALHENASPHARPTRPTRAHYLGYIIRVVAYGRGYAGGMFWGAKHREMGRRNGALCTLPDFPMRLSHEPGLWIYSGHQYRHVRTTLAGHIRAAARPRHVRPDDTTTHTHPHSPLHSAFQHQILAGLQSPNEYNPPTNKQHRQ